MENVRTIAPRRALPELARFRVVDVRKRCDFLGPLGHIRGAEHQPLSTLRDLMRKLSLYEPLLMVSGTGLRSDSAAQQLAASCFMNVTQLAGGMVAWNDCGLPVQRWTARSLGELHDEILEWFAAAAAVSREKVLPTFRCFLEAQGGDFNEPTASMLADALQRIRQLARHGGSDPADLDARIRHFERSLEVL